MSEEERQRDGGMLQHSRRVADPVPFSPRLLATAIVISGVLMLFMANTVSEFLKKNRKYEVLGLFILLIVGVVLLGEGGHESHLKLFGYAVEPMSKTTFYFSVAVLVAVDVIQSGYKKKLEAERLARSPLPDGKATVA